MKKFPLLFGIVSMLTFGTTQSVYSASTRTSVNDRTITVQGQAHVSVIPDIAVLSIEASQDGAELDPVLSSVRDRITKIRSALKTLAVADKDIRTEAFQVHPKYEQDKRGNPKPVGYTVTNRISVKVRDLSKTGKVLTSVINSGASTVDGPRFDVDNPETAEREALSAATRDAKSKAVTVAEAAGVQLSEILTINPQGINWPGPVRPMMTRGVAMMATMDAQEPISAGEQSLSATVLITYSIH